MPTLKRTMMMKRRRSTSVILSKVAGPPKIALMIDQRRKSRLEGLKLEWPVESYKSTKAFILCTQSYVSYSPV